MRKSRVRLSVGLFYFLLLSELIALGTPEGRAGRDGLGGQNATLYLQLTLLLAESLLFDVSDSSSSQIQLLMRSVGRQ